MFILKQGEILQEEEIPSVVFCFPSGPLQKLHVNIGTLGVQAAFKIIPFILVGFFKIPFGIAVALASS